MIRRLGGKHRIFCTSRSYREVSNLAKIRKLNVKLVGKHGGGEKLDKLQASVKRTEILTRIIKKQEPDIVVSFCSPEASRVAFGLGIKHIAFSDSPHAKAVMRLSVPLVQKLLIPWIIPKKEFTKFGIKPNDIIPYKSIDAAVTLKRIIPRKSKILFFNNRKKVILIRVEEDQAAYITKSNNKSDEIIKLISKEFSKEKIIILGRYPSQIKFLKKRFGKNTTVLEKVADGKELLEHTDVFIGSGGTMTAESALMGIPTISFYAVPNFIENYLIHKKLINLEKTPKNVLRKTKLLLKKPTENQRKIAKNILDSMEDPYSKLEKTIRLLL